MNRLFRAIVLLAGLLLPDAAGAQGLQIIANPSVDSTRPLTVDQIAAIYLLRITTWPDGSHIVPVNRESSSETRAQFTAGVLHSDKASLSAYWNEMHFRGKLPPIIQESEQAMLTFVQKVPGSVGYISTATRPVDVKVLAIVR